MIILLPAIAVFVLLFLAHRPLLAALYGPDFAATDGAAALLFTGSAVRIASWIPLFALYAMRRTPAITIGELLSLPLFAVLLLVFKNDLSLETAGALWTASYVAYGAFNFWAVKRGQ
jgi:O-antigen/teichoic acid export membrane protein